MFGANPPDCTRKRPRRRSTGRGRNGSARNDSGGAESGMRTRSERGLCSASGPLANYPGNLSARRGAFGYSPANVSIATVHWVLRWVRPGIERPPEATPRAVSCSDQWSGRSDSNARPPEPHSGALPGCATPRGGPVYLTGPIGSLGDADRHGAARRRRERAPSLRQRESADDIDDDVVDLRHVGR